MPLRLLLLLACLAVSLLRAQDPARAAPTRPVAPWPPPAGPLRVIIDADAANEVDDQWAIGLALGFPERLKIEGFVSAHYGLRGGAKGIEKSHRSILEVLAAAGAKDRFIVKRGSDPVVYRDRIPESEGVDFIIERARAGTPEDPLWLILLGPATNGVAALMKAPDIADKIILFWHGRSDWPRKCGNFNAYNDIYATQLIFEQRSRFVLFDTGANLTMPMPESERRVGAVGPLGRLLHGIRIPSPYARGADKGMFDLGDIAALIDPSVVTFENVPQAPGVRLDQAYDFKQQHGPIVRIPTIDRDKAFALLDTALARQAAAP